MLYTTHTPSTPPKQVGSFEIEDLLCGARSLHYRHLATSLPLTDEAQYVDHDLFFEADEMLTDTTCALTAAAVESPRIGGGGGGSLTVQQQQAEARTSVLTLMFARIHDASPLYANVDTQLGIKVCVCVLCVCERV